MKPAAGQLNEEIKSFLSVIYEPYGTVNATAEALRASIDLLDQQVAGRLHWYISYVTEERAAGRMG